MAVKPLSLKRALLIVSMSMISFKTFAQTDIFQLMQRQDLTLQEIEKIADRYFDSVGTGQGSGHKQYQRWLYEQRFHTDAKGNFISADAEYKAYSDAVKNMGLKSRSSLTWKELGPWSWNYTSSWNPGVGRITSVAVDPSDEKTIFISSPGGGIWKSADSGKTWNPLIDFENSSWLNVFHICIDPNNKNTVYASLSNGGVLKTTDGGTTWKTTGSGPSGTKKVLIHPDSSHVVFATAGNGIYRSSNGGTSWKRVQTEAKEDIEFCPSNRNIMYASASSGSSSVWRSVDVGLTWNALDTSKGIRDKGRTLLGVSPNNPAVVYAVQARGNVFGRLYKSVDTGKTFVTTVIGSAANGTNYFGYGTDGKDTRGQAGYDMAICVNPEDANEVIIAGIICFSSTDGGNTFNALTAWSYPNSVGYNHADVHALEWVNKTVYSGSDGGIYKSYSNGIEWEDLTTGLGIRQLYKISCAQTDANVIVSGAQDNGSSFRTPEGNWIDWLGADGMDNMISPTDAKIAIGTSQYGSIYKTTNGGLSQFGLPKPADGNWVTPLVMHPTNHDTAWGGWTGVYRTDDGGGSWNTISPNITVKMTCLTVAPSNPRYIYASAGSTLYVTKNAGENWTSVSTASSITSIFVSHSNPEKIWITCNSSSNRVLVSENAGDTFINISAGLPAMAARSVVVDNNKAESVYVGMNIGVYYRDSITKTWELHATGLPNVSINEVEIQKSGAKLRVATYGRGIWESYLRKQDCGDVSELEATVVNEKVNLSWNKGPGATRYQIRYYSSQSADTTYVVTSDTFLQLTGLPIAMYTFSVRTFCGIDSSNFQSDDFEVLVNSYNQSSYKLDNSIKVYPVPASSRATIQFISPVAGSMQVQVYSADGKLVHRNEAAFVKGINIQELSVKNWKSGIYYIQIAGGEYAGSQKLIVDNR